MSENDTNINFSVAQTIAELDTDVGSKLPEEAIRRAQKHRDEMIPALIQSIRDAVNDFEQTGIVPSTDAHFFALYLLTEFEAKEALPVIVEAVSLPEETPFELFGDSVTESLSCVFAALADDSLDTLDRLILNKEINFYVRWAAVGTFQLLVRDEVLTREETVERLYGYFQEVRLDKDYEFLSVLVSELISYSPHEIADEIRQAFDQDLIDPAMISRRSLERSLGEDQAYYRQSLERCRPTGFEDTVAELRKWHAFSMNEENLDWTDDSDFQEKDHHPPETIVNYAPKVGRNEPCPCGSGKKYKKCCGRN